MPRSWCSIISIFSELKIRILAHIFFEDFVCHKSNESDSHLTLQRNFRSLLIWIFLLLDNAFNPISAIKWWEGYWRVQWMQCFLWKCLFQSCATNNKWLHCFVKSSPNVTFSCTHYKMLAFRPFVPGQCASGACHATHFSHACALKIDSIVHLRHKICRIQFGDVGKSFFTFSWMNFHKTSHFI